MPGADGKLRHRAAGAENLTAGRHWPSIAAAAGELATRSLELDGMEDEGFLYK